MSRSKRQRDDMAPALFPFLAVLLCTIGALTLILVLTVANSHASARREAESTLTEVQDTKDLVEVMSEELKAQREDLKSKLEVRRKALTDIEDHISRLTNTLDQLALKIERIQTETIQTDAERASKTQQVAALREEVEQKKKELIDAIEQQKKRKPAFAVIPYSGANGTSRRPVYLECTKDGLIIQPEGLVIGLNDLQPPYGPGNPLDAALRVLRLTYQQKDVNFGITLPPYPLLLIRPDGIKTYALAREAMSGWDDQFGYELVDNAMELKFPQSPVGLKDQLSSTLEMAKRRQQALVASMPRRVVQDGNDNWDTIDASNVLKSPGSETSSSGTDAASNHEAGSGFSPGGRSPSEWQMVQGMANSQVANAIQKNGFESSQASSSLGNLAFSGNPTPLSTPNASTSQGKKLTGHFEVAQVQDAFGQPAIQPGGGTRGGALSSATDIKLGEKAVPSKGNFGGTHGSGEETHENTNAMAQSGTAQSGTAQSGSNSSNNNSTAANGVGTNAPAPPGANAFSSGTATGGGASAVSANGSPGQDPTDPSASQSVSMSMGPTGEATPPKAKHVRPEGDLKPIAVSAGRGWAASRAEGKATPVSRPLAIVALKDRWLLRTEGSSAAFEANITMAEGPQQAGNQLAQAMRERVDSWGLAVTGGYWSPTLTIEAANDAQQSVARLERLLEGSGVEIKVVPLTLPKSR